MYHYQPPKSSVWGHSLGKMDAPRAHELIDKFLATSAAEYRRPPNDYCRSFVVTKWRIGDEEVATLSFLTLGYTQHLRLTTMFTFDSIEQFHHIRRVLEDLGLCKLNEKHLKLVRGKKPKPKG